MISCSAYDDIQRYIQQLPASLQKEAVDFVQYLLQKAEQEAARQEGIAWSALSLSAAMRDIEQEDTPQYTTADLKEVFLPNRYAA